MGTTRRGLKAFRKAPQFEVQTFDLRLKPGIDPDRANQLVDELQVAEQLTTYRNPLRR